jgi:hypothetical protein
VKREEEDSGGRQLQFLLEWSHGLCRISISFDKVHRSNESATGATVNVLCPSSICSEEYTVAGKHEISKYPGRQFESIESEHVVRNLEPYIVHSQASETNERSAFRHQGGTESTVCARLQVDSLPSK